MDEKTREALAYLKWACPNDGNTLRKYKEALAHLQAMAEENAALKAEVEKIKAGADKWMAKFAETAKGLTEERDAAHSREALSAKAYGNLCSERDKLKAEVGRLTKKWVDSMGDHVAVSEEATGLQARAEKAEADRDVFKHNLGMEIMRASNYAEEFRKVEADLARYRRYDKLIEAAEKLPTGDVLVLVQYLKPLIDSLTQVDDDAWYQFSFRFKKCGDGLIDELKYAALSCRKSPESDTKIGEKTTY